MDKREDAEQEQQELDLDQSLEQDLEQGLDENLEQDVEPSEVEINIFAEEELTEGASESAEEDISVDIGQAADSLLEVIKSDSLYGLERSALAEELDPAELSPEVGAGAESKAAPVGGALAEHSDLDEPQGEIDLVDDEPQIEISYSEVEDVALDLERAERSRRRLRKILLVCIIILLILTAIIGLFMWRNSNPAAVKNPDSDALQTSSAGTNTTQFQEVDVDRVPDLVGYFGMTPDEAAAASNNTITLDAESTPATDASLPSIKTTRSAWLMGESGDTLATITFGLTDANKIEYIFASFDLDAFGVADARFDELAASRVVAASILTDIGLDQATVDAAQLSTEENPNAVTARDTSKQEIAEFSGSTNRDTAPTWWKVIETYDHTAGISIGDNSVIRTLSVDLR